MTFKVDQNHGNEKKVDYEKMDGPRNEGNGIEEVIENRIYVGGGNVKGNLMKYLIMIYTQFQHG